MEGETKNFIKEIIASPGECEERNISALREAVDLHPVEINWMEVLGEDLYKRVLSWERAKSLWPPSFVEQGDFESLVSSFDRRLSATEGGAPGTGDASPGGSAVVRHVGKLPRLPSEVEEGVRSRDECRRMLLTRYPHVLEALSEEDFEDVIDTMMTH